MQNFTDWFKPYLLSDQNGLNTSALLDDFADLAEAASRDLAAMKSALPMPASMLCSGDIP